MEQQLDTERDLRDSVSEALAVAGSLSRRAPGIFLESSIASIGTGPSALFIIPPGHPASGVPHAGTAGWIRLVEIAMEISPTGWAWARSEDDDGAWAYAEKLFGESSTAMAVTIMLSPRINPDRAIAWAEIKHGLAAIQTGFGAEGF